MNVKVSIKMQETNAERKLTEILYVKAAAILSINLTGLSWILYHLSEPEKIDGPNVFILSCFLIISIVSIFCMFVAAHFKEYTHILDLITEHPTLIQNMELAVKNFAESLETEEFNNLSRSQKNDLIEHFKKNTFKAYENKKEIANQCAENVFNLSFALSIVFMSCVIATIYLWILT